MKSLIITLVLTATAFAADPKPGLSDAQKLHIRDIEIQALQLELNRLKATAPYEMQESLLQSQLSTVSTDAIKAFKLDPAKWRINPQTLEFEEIPEAQKAPGPVSAHPPERQK